MRATREGPNRVAIWRNRDTPFAGPLSRDEPDFELARAELATALGLGMVKLPAADLILADDMPKPPYAIGQTEHWNRLGAALAEFLERARRSPEEVGNSDSARRREA